jgi:hypothetical protein
MYTYTSSILPVVTINARCCVACVSSEHFFFRVCGLLAETGTRTCTGISRGFYDKKYVDAGIRSAGASSSIDRPLHATLSVALQNCCQYRSIMS